MSHSYNYPSSDCVRRGCPQVLVTGVTGVGLDLSLVDAADFFIVVLVVQ